jgi:hypothetical protein
LSDETALLRLRGGSGCREATRFFVVLFLGREADFPVGSGAGFDAGLAEAERVDLLVDIVRVRWKESTVTKLYKSCDGCGDLVSLFSLFQKSAYLVLV